MNAEKNEQIFGDRRRIRSCIKKKIQSTWRFLNFPPGFSAVKKIFSIQFIIVLQCRTSQFQTLSLNLQPPSKLVPPLGSLVLNMCLECLISLCLWLSRVCVFFSLGDSTLNIPPGTIQNAENSATILFVCFTFSTLETVPNVQEKKTMISLFCIPSVCCKNIKSFHLMHFNVVYWLPKRARADCANLKWEHAAYAIDYLFLLVLFSVSSSSRFVIPGQRGVVHVQSLFHQVRFRSLLLLLLLVWPSWQKKMIFLLKFLDRISCLVSLKIMIHRMLPFHLGGIRLHQLFVTFFLHEVVSVHSNRVSMAPATPIDLNEIRHAVTWKRVV